MSNDDHISANKRFRSPPYPAISLSTAVERATTLYAKAAHHSVGWPVLADAWEYKLGSGSLGATAAALIQFGLLTDDGTGDKRKFTLSDAAIRIIRDVDPQSEKRRDATRRAALLPKIYQELWDKYGDCTGVSDVVITNYLTLDRKDEGKAPYGDEAARAIISEYKETVTYAGLSKSDTVATAPRDKGDTGASKLAPKFQSDLPPPSAVKVGDFVQWLSNGANQFAASKRVEWVSDDGQFARVLGSHTGLPVSELTVTAPPARESNPSHGASESSIEVFMAANGRLQVSANVDAEGLQKLRDLLEKYDEILKVLSRTVGSGKPPSS